MGARLHDRRQLEAVIELPVGTRVAFRPNHLPLGWITMRAEGLALVDHGGNLVWYRLDQLESVDG